MLALIRGRDRAVPTLDLKRSYQWASRRRFSIRCGDSVSGRSPLSMQRPVSMTNAHSCLGQVSLAPWSAGHNLDLVPCCSAATGNPEQRANAGTTSIGALDGRQSFFCEVYKTLDQSRVKPFFRVNQ